MTKKKKKRQTEHSIRDGPHFVPAHLVSNIGHLAARAAGQGMHQEKKTGARRATHAQIRSHGTLPIILSTNTRIWYHNNGAPTLRKGECGTHP